jgi:hypothetical protein
MAEKPDRPVDEDLAAKYLHGVFIALSCAIGLVALAIVGVFAGAVYWISTWLF